VLEFSDAAERLLDLRGFDRELPRIGDVLVAASAATPEIRARRSNAIRRRGFDGCRATPLPPKAMS